MSNVTINQLSAKDTLAAGDQVPVFSTADGDTRKASMTAVAAFVADNIPAGNNKTVQYAAPSTSPFTVAVTSQANRVWLILTPTGTLATGTVTLPPVGTAVDGQEVYVTTTQQITSLTVSSSGLTVRFPPTSLGVNGFFAHWFDSVTQTWYRMD